MKLTTHLYVKPRSRMIGGTHPCFHDMVIDEAKKTKSVAVVRKRTIPTERPPLVGEVSANL
jgi:hypothetical protein